MDTELDLYNQLNQANRTNVNLSDKVFIYKALITL